MAVSASPLHISDFHSPEAPMQLIHLFLLAYFIVFLNVGIAYITVPRFFHV